MSAEWVQIGAGVRAHGIRGEVRLAPLAGDPSRFYAGLSVVWRRSGLAERSLTVRAARGHAERVFLSFEEIPDRTAAETLNGGTLWATADTSPEPDEGEWYHHQLLGLKVEDEAGHPLGKLTAVVEGGAHDNFEITAPGGVRYLVPAVEKFVVEVDLGARRIVLRPIEGLIPDGVLPPKPGSSDAR